MRSSIERLRGLGPPLVGLYGQSGGKGYKLKCGKAANTFELQHHIFHFHFAFSVLVLTKTYFTRKNWSLTEQSIFICM